MPDDSTTVELEKMREEWDQRARENARYYVASGQEQWSDEEYFRSGEVNVEREVLTDMGNICQGKDPREMSVLEIGCGAGRITRALAKQFGEVYAVDISGEMVRQARLALHDFPNAHVFQNNGRISPSCGRLRAAFRWISLFRISCSSTFPSREVIENYVREAHGLLRPGALFKFQVQGFIDDNEPRDSWLGASFTEEQAREMAERCGFEMRYHHGAGDQYYWLWFFKKAGE